MRLQFHKEIADPAEPFEPFYDAEEHKNYGVSFSEGLAEVRSHLTQEELICVSLFKNSTRNKNGTYCDFLKKCMGKTLSSSAITHKKKRVFAALSHVGALLRYKRENNMDNILKDLLTNMQYTILVFYERRLPTSKIQQLLKEHELQSYPLEDQEIIKKCWKNKVPPPPELNAPTEICTCNAYRTYRRAMDRLNEEKNNPVIKRYLNLLGNVLKFSRKRNIR